MEFGMKSSGHICTIVVRRLLGSAHCCVVHDINPDAVGALVEERPAGLPGGA
jgi:6-phosphogluconate dehydrogenase (decarboxylating)